MYCVALLLRVRYTDADLTWLRKSCQRLRLARSNWPLHYFVFRQTASHLPHEGNVEQIFSLGGRLSDPNMNPAYLATLVTVGANEKVFMPSKKDIFQRYVRKFSKQGKLLEEEDLGLVTSEATADSPAPAPQAEV